MKRVLILFLIFICLNFAAYASTTTDKNAHIALHTITKPNVVIQFLQNITAVILYNILYKSH